MKKSYHSNTVPAADAAITSRMSLAVGWRTAGASATLAMLCDPSLSPGKRRLARCPGENRRRGLAHGAGAHPHAEPLDAAVGMQDEVQRQRAAACRRADLAADPRGLDRRPLRELHRTRQQLGGVE